MSIRLNEAMNQILNYQHSEDMIENNNDIYESRILFLPDAHPNYDASENGFIGTLNKYALEHKMYTTVIGVGVDFNTFLVEQMSTVKGCNWYSVHSYKEFDKTMNKEFDYIVNALLFNVKLSVKFEGNQCCILDVYGSDKQTLESVNDIISITTLFPSPPNPDEQKETKGGIILLKLKKIDEKNKNINVTINISYENKRGKTYESKVLLCLNAKNSNNKHMYC